MRPSGRLVPALLALLGGAGCAGWGEMETVSVEVRPLPPESARDESIALLESGGRTIRVRRAFVVPDACRRLVGEVARAGDRLSLRISALPGEGACPAAESYLAYTAVIEGVTPGQYNLRVIHGYPRERRRSELVLEHPVRVEGSRRVWKPWN
jgi:hypothetical protein